MSIRVWDKGPHWKQGRTAMKIAKKKLRGRIKAHEDGEKAKVRKRDKVCRFPRCGCRRLGLPLEVSHNATHKGMGGNPHGDRSLAHLLVLLCRHRHQHGRVSRHAGTMRAVPLSMSGYDGRVDWQIRANIANEILGIEPAMRLQPEAELWVSVGAEMAIGVLGPLEPWQIELLTELTRMEW